MASIENIKLKLDEFVSMGGNVNDLGVHDKLYNYISDAKVYDDGKRLTVEEKFLKAGHPRHRKRTSSVEQDIIDGIKAYREHDGDFNVEVKTLPFIGSVFTYIRKRREKYGEALSVDQVLRRFGVEEVSAVYRRFKDIMKLKDYKDNEGFVDTYRKNEKFKNYINSAAETLNIPIAVVVGLIGNQNLKKYTLNVDYLLEVKTELEDYSKKHSGSFKYLKTNDPSLYYKLSHVTKYFSTYVGEILSKNDVLNILDVDHNMTDFNGKVRKENTEITKEIIEELKRISNENGGIISAKDLSDPIYYRVVLKANRMGLYIGDYLKALDLKYVGGREVDRFARMKVDEYPCMKEMRGERDKLYSEIYPQIENKPKEIQFEHYFDCCIKSYNKYKDKIHNFSIQEENEVDDDLNDE